MKRLIGWIACRLPKWLGGGHLRGKRIEKVTHSDLTVEATIQCPRCKATWKRKETPKQAKLALAAPPATDKAA